MRVVGRNNKVIVGYGTAAGYGLQQELMSRPKGGEGAYNLRIPCGYIQT